MLNPAAKVRRVLVDARVRNLLLYDNLQTLASRHGADESNLTHYELKLFSQNGEDGVVAEILRRVGTEHRYFAEIGVGAGSEGNCVYLADVLSWRGVFIEVSDEAYASLDHKYRCTPPVTTLNERATAENIEALLTTAQAPADLDLLSIDVDGNDYWVWEAIVEFRPRVVIIEYNGGLPLDSTLVQPYAPMAEWDRTDYFGASLGALERLGNSKGYLLAHTELSGTNAFFVRSDLREALGPLEPVPRRALNQSLQGVGHVRALDEREYVEVGNLNRDPSRLTRAYDVSRNQAGR